MSNPFALIIAGKLSATKVFENERILAIEDINPVAPIHILIMPKREIKNLQSLCVEDMHLIGEIVEIAQKLARHYRIEEGYRLLTNNGSSSGQTIFHLHFHLIGGRPLGTLG